MAGGGSTKDSSGKKRARIEIIPLIDVIFFLLATFVLFTLSLNKSNGVEVKLPDSRTGEPRDPAGTITVSILQDGSYAVNKDNVNVEEMENRLKAFHLEHPEPDAHILINGDAEASFSAAIFAIDEARRLGIQKVLIETQTAPAGN